MALRHLNSVYKHLWRLEHSGYIEHSFHRWLSHIYRLTPKGHGVLCRLRQSEFRRVVDWPSELQHALMAAGVSLFFSMILGLRVVPERKLRTLKWSAERNLSGTKREFLPDLKFIYEGRELRGEIELSAKNNDRYIALWNRLPQPAREDSPYVFYVVEGEGLADMILRLAGSEFFPGIYVATVENLCRDGARAAWKNFTGTEFRFERKA